MIKIKFSRQHIEQLIKEFYEIKKQESFTHDEKKLNVLRGKAVALFEHLRAIGVNPYSYKPF